jgi:hypothetical protein
MTSDLTKPRTKGRPPAVQAAAKAACKNGGQKKMDLFVHRPPTTCSSNDLTPSALSTPIGTKENVSTQGMLRLDTSSIDRRVVVDLVSDESPVVSRVANIGPDTARARSSVENIFSTALSTDTTESIPQTCSKVSQNLIFETLCN